jgi:hypothetical protein
MQIKNEPENAGQEHAEDLDPSGVRDEVDIVGGKEVVEGDGHLGKGVDELPDGAHTKVEQALQTDDLQHNVERVKHVCGDTGNL